MNFAQKRNFFNFVLVHLIVSIQIPFGHCICKHPETIEFGDAKVICADECIFYCIPDYYYLGEAIDRTSSNCTFSSIASIATAKNVKHPVNNMFMEMSICNLSTASVLEATKKLDIGVHCLKLNGATFIASDSFTGFEQITHLYLTNMPANSSALGASSLRHLLNVKYFEISNNHIDSLPEHIFINQTELEFLNLTQNHLKSLPIGIFKYAKKLVTLDLSHNQLETIYAGTFDDLTDLDALDLSYNQLNFDELDELQSPLMDLVRLKSLNLAENHLITLPNTIFSHMNGLHSLDLSGNQLEHIQSALFDGLINLKHLNLSSNKISTFPVDLLRNNDRNLELIDLSDNRLETINDEDLQKFKNQRTELLHLKRNPWKCECDSAFNRFLQTQQRLGHFNNVECNDRLTIIKKLDVCDDIAKYERLKIIILSLVCGFGLFIIVVVAAVCYKNKHKPNKTRSKKQNHFR